jgi:hypothetical protein
VSAIRLRKEGCIPQPAARRDAIGLVQGMRFAGLRRSAKTVSPVQNAVDSYNERQFAHLDAMFDDANVPTRRRQVAVLIIWMMRGGGERQNAREQVPRANGSNALAAAGQMSATFTPISMASSILKSCLVDQQADNLYRQSQGGCRRSRISDMFVQV